MPKTRKLTPDQVQQLESSALGPRQQAALQYDAFLQTFAVGDYGEAVIHTGEKRTTVRSRLVAAARRRGLVLRFRPTAANRLLFRVDAMETSLPPAGLGKPPTHQQRPPSLPDEGNTIEPLAWLNAKPEALQPGMVLDLNGLIVRRKADEETLAEVIDVQQHGRTRQIVLRLQQSGRQMVWDGASTLQPFVPPGFSSAPRPRNPERGGSTQRPRPRRRWR